MTTTTAPAAQIPAPLATDAATASTAIGPCHLCQRDIRRGDHYCRTVPAGRIAHVFCVALAGETPARRPA